MVLRSLATRMPYWGFAGSCFFLAWMNGAFFTTALSGFRLQVGAASDIGLYWNLSLIGVFAGLVTLTACEGRFGQLALRPNVLVASTVFVCAGTLLMLVDPAVAPDAVVVLGYVGGFATGFFTAPFYIAWSQVYGLLDIDQAELVIPLAVALGQLLSLVFCGLEGWLAAACLVAAPALTLACLLGSFARLGWGGEGATAHSAGKGEARTGAPASRPVFTSSPTVRPTLTGARFGLFVAVVWLVLSLMTTLTNSRVSNDFAHAYLVPFLVSFVVLLALLLLYVGYTKRLSLLQTARIVVPVMVVSLLAVLVLPRDIVPDAFLVERTAVMFFWAIIWIFCAKAINRGWASATTVMGRVRGWIQGGAALSIPVGMVMQGLPHPAAGVVYLSVALLVAVFAFSLPALMDASDEGSLPIAGPACGMPTDEIRPPDAATSGSGISDGYAARCAALGERFGFSPRETEIMGYLVRGRDLPFIRDALYISRNTINTHVRHIYGKMGIHSKQELIDLFEQPDPPRES